MFSWYTGSILAVNLDILHCGQTQIDLSVLQAMFSCLPLQARVCEILSYVSHWKQLSLFSQSCLTLCDPMDCSTPGFPYFIISQSLLKLMSVESVMPSNHLILCHSVLLLPSVFPSIRVFSNELALPIRWPKYWSFSFSISPFNEYSGLISFRID